MRWSCCKLYLDTRAVNRMPLANIMLTEQNLQIFRIFLFGPFRSLGSFSNVTMITSQASKLFLLFLFHSFLFFWFCSYSEFAAQTYGTHLKPPPHIFISNLDYFHPLSLSLSSLLLSSLSPLFSFLSLLRAHCKIDSRSLHRRLGLC